MQSVLRAWPAVVAVLLAIASVAGPSRADVAHSADLRWYSLETAHFTIHYHEGLEDLAERSAAVAEAAHDDLSARLDWTPKTRTTIVVTDEIGQTNGFATPFPHNHIGIYVTPPDTVGTLADHRSWLETVIRHEYVHILHMDRVASGPAGARRLFGRVAFPNAFQPRWAIEGLAQKLEAPDGARAGRAQDSATAMYMRMETLGGIDPLDKVSHAAASWPGGRRPYLYGVAFQNFLEDRYGVEARRRWVAAQSAEGIPFRYSPALRAATGKDKDSLWREFGGWLRGKHAPTLTAIREAGVRAGEPLTRTGEQTGRPHADGADHVVHVRNTRDGPPSLQRRHVATGESRRLGTVRAGARLAVAPDRPILVAQPAACDNARRYYDLYRFPRDGSSGTRLTRCGRYRHVAWGDAPGEAYALRQEGGQPALVRLRVAEGGARETTVLWQGRAFTALDGLELSPDGQHLLAGRWDREHGWHIAEFDLARDTWHVVQARQAVEMQPRYSPDGKRIFYTADYGGIYDIRRLDRATGQVVHLTRVEGGAFAPAHVAGDSGRNALVFLNYGPEGFDLHRRSLVEPPAAGEVPARGASAAMGEAPATPETSDPKPYSALSSDLRPAYWLPELAIASDRTFLGASTSGSDALARHNYAVSAGYEFTNGLPTAGLDYVYDRFFPVPKVSLQRNLGYDSAAGQVMLPWLGVNRRFSLHVGATLRSPRSSPYGAAIDRDIDTRANPLGVAGVLDTTHRWPLSISPSHGRFVTLALEHEDLVGNPDYSGPVAVGDWREYIGLWGQHVLHLRTAGGYGLDAPQPFQLGGFAPGPTPPGLTSFPSRTNPLNRRSFALRGYSSDDARLAGPAVAMATAEYRLPVQRVERGLSFLPVAVQHVSGRLAVDAGEAWPGGAARRVHVGTAMEGLARLNLGYGGSVGLAADLRLGLAKGHSARGQTQLYVTFGAPF